MMRRIAITTMLQLALSAAARWPAVTLPLAAVPSGHPTSTYRRQRSGLVRHAFAGNDRTWGGYAECDRSESARQTPMRWRAVNVVLVQYCANRMCFPTRITDGNL